MGGSFNRALSRALWRASERLLELAAHVPMPPLSPAMLDAEERARLRRNAVFSRRHSGKRCFVIGTGPSLAGLDLTPLGREITFVTNSFFTHPIMKLWHPTYHVVIDPLCFDDTAEAHDYLRRVAATSGGTSYFVPLYFFKRLPAYARVCAQGLLPEPRTYFVALGGDKQLGPVRRLDPTVFLPPLLNVTQACIALAMYMGCSPIYLLGLDHDWLARPGSDVHFYDERPDLEHALSARNAPLLANYDRQLGINERVWRGYHLLGRLALQRGTAIRNATIGGFLDVFPRAAYEAVVAAAPGPPS